MQLELQLLQMNEESEKKPSGHWLKHQVPFKYLKELDVPVLHDVQVLESEHVLQAVGQGLHMKLSL